MTTAEPSLVEIEGLVVSLNANTTYRNQRWEFQQRTANPPPTTSLHQPTVHIDTENIRVTYSPVNSETGQAETDQSMVHYNGGNIMMKRDDVKRLNLTVGDKIVLRVTKE